MTMMNGFPDLLRTARMGRLQTDAKQALADASYEATTGLARDQIAATKGDPMKLFGLQARMATLESREPLVNVAKARADTTAAALTNIDEQIDTIGHELASFAQTGDVSSADKIARQARMALSQVMNALGGSVGSRLLFSGEKTGTAPLASAETLLDDMAAAIAPPAKPAIPPAPLAPGSFITDYVAPTLAETEAATVDGQPISMDSAVQRNVKSALEQVAIYFGEETHPSPSPPEAEAFDTNIYKGGSKSPPKVELGDNDHLDYTIKANNPALKKVMRFLALAAQIENMPAPETPSDAELRQLSGYPAGATPDLYPTKKTEIVEQYHRDTKLALYKEAAIGLIQSKDGLTELRADLGLSQKRIDEAITANKAESTTLQTVRTDIIGVDAYTAATRVTELESQLQAIYMVTARTARLSFLDYMG